ncbi:MSC_0620 family F1-like ATPase-associated subunit [Mycoplasma zalophi]|uniref:MSC_0620 family F1-like ATPase-associated subunit n=1 Tax=Mycoplasma zalophi TaxID=191287 RepID=UPI001C0FE391|nr:hypothetical protein [Mycoplasma zalophi]MBU4690937.1 hypothetical protein [Mycoplasma zalophi]
MNKKLKFLLSLSTLSVVALPFSAISAAGDSSTSSDSTSNSDSPNTPAETEKPKKISDNFSTFKKMWEDVQTQMLDQAIKIVQGFLKDELLKLESDTETEYKQKLSKQIYFAKLNDFFEKHKDDIMTNPDKYGFYITFPHVLSREKNHAVGSVTLNDKKFNNIVFGFGGDEQTKYDRALGKEASVKESEELNYVEDKEYEETINGYSKDLLEQIKAIVFNSDDVLYLDDKIALENKDIQANNATVNGFFVTNPKDYDSWDNYFIDKIKPRFLEYDLQKNQQFREQQEQQQQQNKPPELPTPLIPGDPVEPESVDTIIEAIPALNPQIKAEFTNLSFAQLQAKLQENTEEIFFFNNPINIRYEYKVNSIAQNNNKNIATISIKDVNNPSVERVYKQTFTIDNSQTYKNHQKLYFNQIDSVQKLMTKFYKALDLDNKLQYENLGQENLISNVFSLVDAFTKLIHSNNYVNEQEHFIQNVVNNNNFENNESSILSNSSTYIDSLFLDITSAMKFSGFNPWYTIAKTYERVLDIYQTEFFRFNKEIILKNYQTANQDFHIIDKIMKVLEKDIFRLVGISNSKTINKISWFDNYTNLIAKINGNFKKLRDIVTINEVTEENKQKFIEAIEVAKNVVLEQETNLATKKTMISSIILAISFMVFITNATLMTIFRKTLKNKKILLTNILFFAFTTILIITSIVLLII